VACEVRCQAFASKIFQRTTFVLRDLAQLGGCIVRDLDDRHGRDLRFANFARVNSRSDFV
jgi:hypothetical protein